MTYDSSKIKSRTRQTQPHANPRYKQHTARITAFCISFVPRVLLANGPFVIKGCVLSTFVCLKKCIDTTCFLKYRGRLVNLRRNASSICRLVICSVWVTSNSSAVWQPVLHNLVQWWERSTLLPSLTERQSHRGTNIFYTKGKRRDTEGDRLYNIEF